MIPVSTIIMISLAFALALAVPVTLWVLFVRKGKCSFLTILVGILVFFVAVVILEAAVHQVVLGGPAGAVIKGRTLYYALYGGLMAGLFEECGRFVAMKFILRRAPDKLSTGLAYGAGHGGAEMMIILASAMLTNLVLAIAVNTGKADTLLAAVPLAARPQLEQSMAHLQTISGGLFLFSIWERVSALILQLSLSVFVWTAVRRGGKWLWLFPAAILLHALVDGSTVMMNGKIGLAGVETFVFALSLAYAAAAFLIARKSKI